jgi:hypothetical protein
MNPIGFRARARIETDERQLPVVIGRAIWDNCPILLAIDAAMIAACVPALLLTGAGGLVGAPLLLALMFGPVWMAALTASEALLDGEGVGMRQFAGMIGAGWRSGLRIALPPAAIATVLLGTLALAGGAGRTWMLAPAAIDALVLSGAGAAALGAGWLAARGSAVDRALWRRGALLAGSAPLAICGLAALAVLIGMTAQVTGPLAIGFLAAPFAVTVAATFRHVATVRPDA